MNKNKLKHFIIRVSKADAAFIYFQFESNEGLCFFSTMKSSLKEPFRDIEIFSPISLEQEIDHLLNYLGQSIDMQFLLTEVIPDSTELMKQYLEN
jgi:hypothetical protein